MPRSLLLVRLGLPLFYGYVILLVATIGKILSAPGQSPCIGVVVDCVMVSLGLSRSVTSALYLVATVGSAATLQVCMSSWRAALALLAAALPGGL